MSGFRSLSAGPSDETAFDPTSNLRLAQLLASDTSDESQLRCSIGRVYYALFLVSREQLNVRQRRGVHERVTVELAQRGHHGIASKLGQLRTMREIADYQLLPANPRNRDWRRNWTYVRGVANRLIREMAELQWLTEDHQLD